MAGILFIRKRIFCNFVGMKSLLSVIVSLIVLCVVVAACGRSRGAEEQLDRADALIDTHPDSAFLVLDSLSINNLSDAQKAR